MGDGAHESRRTGITSKMRRVFRTSSYIPNATIIILTLLILAVVSRAQVLQKGTPEELKGIDVEEHLGKSVPLDLVFTNDRGEKVELSRYFAQGKPVILVLAYYECPMLCTLVLNGVASALKELDWTAGQEFNILTVSIDPSETHELAAAKKKNLLAVVDKSGTEAGWTFFVGEQPQITALTEAVGFKYFYDEKQKQFAHPAVVTILTGTGEISRYLYGVDFKKQDMRLSLLEASRGEIGSTIDKIILYCFHYDPDAKGYVLFASNVMKLGGLVTVSALALFLAMLWARERRRKATLALGH